MDSSSAAAAVAPAMTGMALALPPEELEVERGVTIGAGVGAQVPAAF